VSALSAGALSWCERHAIDPAVLDRVGIVERGDYLVLPNGRQLSLNGRRPKVKQPGGQQLAMWWPNGEPDAGDSPLITEGESDLLAALSADPALIAGAIPGVTYPVDRIVTELRGVGVVIFGLDGDDEGRRATIEKARALEAAGVACHDVGVPDGCDLADCLVAVPPEERAGWLHERLSDARPVVLAASDERGNGRPLTPFTLLTYDELMQQCDPAWLIDGLLPEGFSVLYSAPEMFKTFLAIDWALSIAAGLPWHGREVQQGFVVYIAAEGRGGLRKRVEAWVADRQPDDLSRMRFLADAVDLLSPDEVERVRQTLASLPEPPVLLVVDTMARTMVGGDENAARDVGRFIHAVDAQDVGARLVVHHTGKDGLSERGSGALRGAADLMVRLERDVQSPRVSVKCDKAKDFERWAPLTLERRTVGGSLVLDHLSWSEAASDAVRGRREKIITFVRKHGPATQSGIEQAVGGKAVLVREMLDQLVVEQLLTVTRVGHAKHFDLIRPERGTDGDG
jgi:hypothetical protein